MNECAKMRGERLLQTFHVVMQPGRVKPHSVETAFTYSLSVGLDTADFKLFPRCERLNIALRYTVL